MPTPRPSPPGVSGLCPIIVDSVMIVSVIVSIARPLITGVASLSRTVCELDRRAPAGGFEGPPDGRDGTGRCCPGCP